MKDPTLLKAIDTISKEIEERVQFLYALIDMAYDEGQITEFDLSTIRHELDEIDALLN